MKLDDDLNRVGFTGTHRARLTVPRLQSIAKLLEERYQYPIRNQPKINRNHFDHGSCINGDDQAGWVAHLCRYYVTVHPPLDDSKRAYSYCDAIEPEKDYIARNHDIVDGCHFLIAAPHARHEVLRSGTWATIRYAFSVHREGVFVWPDGEVEGFTDWRKRVGR